MEGGRKGEGRRAEEGGGRVGGEGGRREGTRVIWRAGGGEGSRAGGAGGRGGRGWWRKVGRRGREGTQVEWRAGGRGREWRVGQMEQKEILPEGGIDQMY